MKRTRVVVFAARSILGRIVTGVTLATLAIHCVRLALAMSMELLVMCAKLEVDNAPASQTILAIIVISVLQDSMVSQTANLARVIVMVPSAHIVIPEMVCAAAETTMVDVTAENAPVVITDIPPVNCVTATQLDPLQKCVTVTMDSAFVSQDLEDLDVTAVLPAFTDTRSVQNVVVSPPDPCVMSVMTEDSVTVIPIILE